jgi:hypothetical protein
MTDSLLFERRYISNDLFEIKPTQSSSSSIAEFFQLCVFYTCFHILTEVRERYHLVVWHVLADRLIYMTGNIGNAKTVGIEEDLNLTDRQWSWVLYSFYICYILFEWTTVMWKILPAHAYIASLCVWYVP